MVYIVDQKRAERIQVEVRDWLESNRKDMGMYMKFIWLVCGWKWWNKFKSIRLIEIDGVESDECANVAVPAAAE